MKFRNLWLALFVSVGGGQSIDAESPRETSGAGQVDAPTTPDQARFQAKLLHETIRGTLQVVHRDFFFDEEDAHAIPSASLEDVFVELARAYQIDLKWLNVQIDLKWLNVQTDVLNVDHQPMDAFERQAAKEIAKGRSHFELVQRYQFRYAVRIRLGSECLKCHVKNRTTTEDRSASLLITIPLGTRKP